MENVFTIEFEIWVNVHTLHAKLLIVKRNGIYLILLPIWICTWFKNLVSKNASHFLYSTIDKLGRGRQPSLPKFSVILSGIFTFIVWIQLRVSLPLSEGYESGFHQLSLVTDFHIAIVRFLWSSTARKRNLDPRLTWSWKPRPNPTSACWLSTKAYSYFKPATILPKTTWVDRRLSTDTFLFVSPSFLNFYYSNSMKLVRIWVWQKISKNFHWKVKKIMLTSFIRILFIHSRLVTKKKQATHCVKSRLETQLK